MVNLPMLLHVGNIILHTAKLTYERPAISQAFGGIERRRLRQLLNPLPDGKIRVALALIFAVPSLVLLVGGQGVGTSPFALAPPGTAIPPTPCGEIWT